MGNWGPRKMMEDDCPLQTGGAIHFHVDVFIKHGVFGS